MFISEGEILFPKSAVTLPIQLPRTSPVLNQLQVRGMEIASLDLFHHGLPLRVERVLTSLEPVAMDSLNKI